MRTSYGKITSPFFGHFLTYTFCQKLTLLLQKRPHYIEDQPLGSITLLTHCILDVEFTNYKFFYSSGWSVSILLFTYYFRMTFFSQVHYLKDALVWAEKNPATMTARIYLA